jgi:hypothetical protein
LDMRKRFRGNPSTTNNKRAGEPAVNIIGFNHPTRPREHQPNHLDPLDPPPEKPVERLV